MNFSWQQLSQVFDEYLNKSHESTESLVEGEEGLYAGLSSEALFTGLEDIRRIQSHPEVRGTWVDLGAGVGQTVLSYLQLYPEREAFGLEKSEARVIAGHKLFRSLKIPDDHLKEADLLTTDLMIGDTYFLYFPTGMVLDRILHELMKKPAFILAVVESHGDLFSRLNLEPALDLMGEVELSSPRHSPVARIYRKKETLLQRPELFNRSFLHNYVSVSETSGEEWIGETFGAEWIGEEKFNLKTPPRTVSHSSLKFLKASELCSLTHFLCELRNRGEIVLVTPTGVLTGEIRKIFVRPAFCLELSGGQKVKWVDILELSLKGHRCYDSSSPSSFSLPAV